MVAKPAAYRQGGWRGDHAFRLSELDRKRLASAPFSLDSADFGWIEEQMEYYNIAIADAETHPTPAQIRAALAEGTSRISALQQWMDELDDATRDMIEMQGADQLADQLKADAWRGLLQVLTLLLDKIEIARRATGDPKAGNLPKRKSKKHVLAEIIVDRFGNRTGLEVLISVLPDLPDTIKRLVDGRNR